MTQLLVTIDVGGTIAHAPEPSLATVLAMASPLDPADARRIVREKLYTQTAIDRRIVAELCDALWIPASMFPETFKASPLRLVPGAITALRSMSRHATLVTLSNVTCLEANPEQMRELLHPWVKDYFPSCRIGHAKPDPAAFRYVATACHTSPADMVHIGDDWVCDIVGARSAGTTAIWISKRRPVPEPERLADCGVLVATDLAGAIRHLIKLASRRGS